MTFEELKAAAETATLIDTIALLHDYFSTWNPDLLATSDEE